MSVHAQEAAPAAAGVAFHTKMAELLALTTAHDRDGARRQKMTADGHEAQQLEWLRMIVQLEEQARLDREA